MPGSPPEIEEWDDDDLEEFDPDETAEDASDTHLRISEATWTELSAIVIGAGGSAKRMAKSRLWLEAIVEFGRTEPPRVVSMVKKHLAQSDKECAATAALADALLKAIEKEGEFGLFGAQSIARELVPEFHGDRIELFAAQLKFIRDRGEHRQSQPRGRKNRLDRDMTWSQIVWHWKNELRMPATTAESSPLLKFILAISKEMPWLQERDLDPQNIRAYLRKLEARQSGEVKPKGGGKSKP